MSDTEQRERERESSSHNQNQHVIKTTKVVYPQIYSYTLPTEPDNEGSQKIGYTERANVEDRINEQVRTAAKHLEHETLWHGPAFFADGKTDFTDKIFHKFLVKQGVPKRDDLGTEWFYFNGTPEKSKQLYDDFREHGFAALQQGNGKLAYTLRDEQEAAVRMALDYFSAHDNGEVLWNAKPRFGKTLSTYDLAKRLQATKVLIVTNRPAIANSWFEDYNQFIDGYYFISETSSLAAQATFTRDQYNDMSNKGPFITFLSLQDLKGSKYFGGSHDKLRWIADLDWDLLVIDEAHEGVDTERTDAAFDIVKRSHTLHLSGTPFRALANGKFPAEAIYNWTYLDEQAAKATELADGESGPHADLPDMRLFTYRISQMTATDVNEGIDIDDETRDYAFDLNEFFATTNRKFDHEADVKAFLYNLTHNTKYPFSTPELRDELRHTFWYVGNRVESVKALEQLLKQDEIFKDYKVIVAAGDGKSFDEEEQDFKGNEKSFDKVKAAIKEHPKTITLSCGQLTTGVTIKEWSAVLMLTDIKTPAQYMQAAFRAQNPYKYMEGGEHKAKQSAYLFDFAPTRVLEIYEQFANGLNPRVAGGEVTEAERKDNVRKLLNFFPVISEDVDGQMVELDAEKVLTFPNALAATEIVQAKFMTNLLFNDNIKGVFHFPKQVEEILDKMPVEKNKRAETSKKELDLDDARKVEKAKTAEINRNTGVILGEKIYESNIDRLVDNATDYNTPEETLETLPAAVEDITDTLIAKYKETYKVTAAEAEEAKREAAVKIKQVVAEFEASDVKDPEQLKTDLKSVIEHDFVQAKVEQQETKKVETVQKSKEEMVREHLRAFTRTIPMFVMANASRGAITIDNFDEQISDEDFIDLTNITKSEFHMLRDGFDYDEDGERGHFGGVFDRYKFNASIAEFVAEKQQRADYFTVASDIFELIPNQKNNQIFTPRKVVQMMVDGLQAEAPELFTRTDSTFIDLYMKSGMYITELVKKLYAGTRHHYASDADCLRHILEKQVYGLAPTGVLHGITTNYIFGFDTTHSISTHNFAQHDLLPQAKDGTAKQKLAELFRRDSNMKFDAVVGNPPYQEETKDTSDNPIYHFFIQSAIPIAHIVSMITPARYLFNAGKTPKDFNRYMLNNRHTRVIYYNPTSSEVFPNTDIKGGVAVVLLNDKVDLKPIGTFTALPELNTLLASIAADITTSSLDDWYETQLKFDLSRLYKDYPHLRNIIGSDGKEQRLTSSILDQLKEVFTDKPISESDLRVIGLSQPGNVRVWKYIKRDYVNVAHPNLDKYKVVLPSSNGSGAIGETLSTPLICRPFTGHTQTFISFGSFDRKSDAEHLLKYIKTKFVRLLLSTLKVTQSNKKGTWKNIPLQNFTDNSDIDWSKSIPEIDQQLYKKYGLDQHEIGFIESHVKEME